MTEKPAFSKRSSTLPACFFSIQSGLKMIKVFCIKNLVVSQRSRELSTEVFAVRGLGNSLKLTLGPASPYVRFPITPGSPLATDGSLLSTPYPLRLKPLPFSCPAPDLSLRRSGQSHRRACHHGSQFAPWARVAARMEGGIHHAHQVRLIHKRAVGRGI